MELTAILQWPSYKDFTPTELYLVCEFGHAHPYRRRASFINSLRISRYNQIKVTIREKPAYHSAHFGARFAMPVSMNWKSRIKFNAAIPTTKRLNRIPIGPEPEMKPSGAWNIPNRRFNPYTNAMPMVA